MAMWSSGYISVHACRCHDGRVHVRAAMGQDHMWAVPMLVQILAQDRQSLVMWVQVSGEAREEQRSHECLYMERSEAGSGYVSVCACRDKGAVVCECRCVRGTEEGMGM